MSQTTAALRLRRAIARTRQATRDRAPVGRRPEDADDVRGTYATDGALGFDPFPFLRALHDAGSQAVVIGQVAGIMHGSTELTGDLDLLWDGTPGEARALRAALAARGCTTLPDLGREQVGYRVTGADGDLCTPRPPVGRVGCDTLPDPGRDHSRPGWLHRPLRRTRRPDPHAAGPRPSEGPPPRGRTRTPAADPAAHGLNARPPWAGHQPTESLISPSCACGAPCTVTATYRTDPARVSRRTRPRPSRVPARR
ncbi:hypothetical protein RKD44_000299 [Streptomyces collinus]